MNRKIFSFYKDTLINGTRYKMVGQIIYCLCKVDIVWRISVHNNLFDNKKGLLE